MLDRRGSLSVLGPLQRGGYSLGALGAPRGEGGRLGVRDKVLGVYKALGTRRQSLIYIDVYSGLG